MMTDIAWLVCTPEYMTYDPGPLPIDPPEYGCDCVEVIALSRWEAIVAGVRVMRSSPECNYHREHYDEHPYKGMTAVLLDLAEEAAND